jgi:O-glycosyl hydrolase
MYRRTQFAAAILVAGLLVACSSSETNPVDPSPRATIPNSLGMSAASVTPTSTAWFYANQLQEIKGWGVYPAAGGNPFWDAPAIQNAIYGLGVTHIRDQIDPALYVSGTTVQNMVLNTALLNQYIAKIQTAKSQGISAYILSVWSPPAAWKTNGSILGTYNGVVGSLQPWAEPYFVAFVTKVMLALQQSSIGLPVAFSIQNEPEQAPTSYGGCSYTVAQWQQVIQDMRGSFDYNGLGSIVLFGPETGQYTTATYLDPVTQSAGYLGGLGYPSLTGYLDHAVGAYALHTYAECSIWQTQQGVAGHPKDMWMTEFGLPVGTTELQWTLDMMSAMAAHLVIIPHNYWFWWLGWSSTTAAPPYGQLLGGTTTPIYSQRFYALQKLFWTVRPGWYVHNLWSSDPDLQAGLGTQNPCTARVNIIGFMNPAGNEAVVEITNVTSNNKQVQIGGLPGTVQTSYRTDASNNMVQQATTNVYKTYSTVSVPANSVVIAIFQ